MKRITFGIPAILFVSLFFLSGIFLYSGKWMDRLDLSGDSKELTYEKHYILLSGSRDSDFWRSVYESAKQTAAMNNAYLERVRMDDNLSYSQDDYLRICIAEGADGIILNPDGSEEVELLMKDAKEAGIPVAVIFNSTDSEGQVTSVGLNSYEMGDTYAGEVIPLLDENHSKVMVLDTIHSANGLAYSQLKKILEIDRKDISEVKVSRMELDTSVDFKAEESVRDLLLKAERPDILVCFDVVFTECAYQAVLDLNLVGEVEIIGFYYSDLILNGISKGTIASTVVPSAEDIGRYVIEGLEDYRTLGHASDFYNASITVITDQNADQLLKEDTL